MGSLQLLKPTCPSPPSSHRAALHGAVSGFFPFFRKRRAAVFRCSLQKNGDNPTNGEEPPESLFMKELRRRGMNPASMLEEAKRSSALGEEEEEEESGGGGGGLPGRRGRRRRSAVFSSAELEKSLANQRERSMALNSEGLEGLVPRAKLLLTIGGTFFLGFGPLILATVGFFSALYLYFGPSFVHDGTDRRVSPPPYVDPYALLEDERISQTAPSLR